MPGPKRTDAQSANLIKMSDPTIQFYTKVKKYSDFVLKYYFHIFVPIG